jgi:glutaminyl-tRNA synthetase
MSDLKPEETKIKNFIEQKIDKDLESGKYQQVYTRFPPEPNGYLHIGHAKSICLNFGLKDQYKGKCNLRFDDTNPETEKQEYIDAIKEDVRWLGFEWDEECYSSDYFQKLYELAVQMIKDGQAYVCHLTPEQTREYRGSLTEPGKNSPYRDRSIEENLNEFEKMKNGEYDEGSCVLRAKIDMSSGNMNMRDPIMYRIKKAHHPRTGDKWCIYPMYDYTHGLSDAFEGVTHSLCTLEFADHRPLYDWYLEVTKTEHRPEQTEFSRLNLDYTVMSKRRLLQLVNEGHVDGWDDPRMLTIPGLRRRGFTPASIRNFVKRTGITKKDHLISMSNLENAIREDLDNKAKRVMAVLDPLKVTITNFPEGQDEEILSASNHPKREEMGRREFPFTKEIYIEKDDFMMDPPKKFFRLGPGRQVRLRYAYVIQCDEVITNDAGEPIELKCSYIPETKSGKTPEGMKKVKGIIHWVSATNNTEIEARVYDRLFHDPNPQAAKENFLSTLNPDSKKLIEKAYLENSVKSFELGDAYQFERLGFFSIDPDTTSEKPVFNRTVTLKDTWQKISGREK